MADDAQQIPSSSMNSHGAESSQNVTVRFLSPSSPEVTLSNVDLDTKIGALKIRLSQQLPGEPQSDRLRFIYFGRPLLDTEETLRNVLSSELKSSPLRDFFTLHVIVQPAASDSTPFNGAIRPGGTLLVPSAGPNLNTTLPHGLPPPPFAQTPLRASPSPGQRVPSPFQPQTHRQHINNGQASGQSQTQILHEMIQQTIQHNLQLQMQALQQEIQQNMTPPNPAQNMPWPQMLGHMPPMPPIVPGLPAGQHPLPQLQMPLGQQQQPRPTGGMDGTQASGPAPGARPASIQAQQSTQNARTATPHRQTSVQEMVGPGGQRMRVTATVESVHVARSGTPQPIVANNVLANTSENHRPEPRPAPMSTHSTGFNPLPSTNGLQSNTLPFNIPMFPNLPQNARPMSTSSPSNTATAWLLSGPRGPQAVLFSPEHGVYHSQSQPTRTRPSSTTARSTVTNRRTGPGPQPRNGLRRPQRLQNQGAAPVVIRRRIEVRQNQDLISIIVGRIWLFVRLYVFALMFTEPGSWLRWCLLGGAVIYCCTPPNNFFQEQFQRLQRHFEGLVPLAPPEPANPRRQPQNNNNNEPTTTADQNRAARQTAADNAPTGSGRRRPEPTPESVAQRILEQQRAQRNANADWWVQATRRVERAVWLFIASLIPGVGERHIRARNEAAEAAARAEREAQEPQQQQQQQQQPQQDGNAGASGAVGSPPAQSGPEAGAPRDGPHQQEEPPLVQV